MSAEPQGTHETERALEEALAERNRLWAELNRERADRRELEHLRRELTEIRASTWWKIARIAERIKALLRTAFERVRKL